MKKDIFILSLVLTTLFFSCSKIDTSGNARKFNFSDSTETKDSLDTTSFGVYKGVLIGSTGRVKIYYNNGDTVMKALLTLDSLSDTLICIVPGIVGAPVINAPFEGRISYFTLSADRNGENALIENISVTNRVNVLGVIAHEKSNQLVSCFETTFTGNERGYFNFVTYGSKTSGVALTNSAEYYKGKGLLTGKIFILPLVGVLSDTSSFEGGLDVNNELTGGTWLKSAISSGSFSGVRTQ